MVCGTFTRTGMTAEEASMAEQMFRANDPPPNKVTRSQAADGTFTVVAEFPPCPPNTTHSPQVADG